MRRSLSPGRVLGRVGLVLLAVPTLLTTFAPVVARHSPTRPSGVPLLHPSLSHPLGTNDLGVDLFSQLVYGGRISLAIGVGSAVLAIVVALIVAPLAGWRRGWVEAVLMRLVDVVLAFPFLPLVLVLAAFFGRSLVTTAIVIGAVSWARPARVLWAQVLKLREAQHVQAARAMGATGTRCVVRHILTRLTPLTSAQFVRVANAAVISEAALAFLGLGDPNKASWGLMLSNASSNNALLTGAWKWWMLPAGLALTTVVVGFAFVGYACEEWADPRLASKGRMRFLVSRPPARQAPDAAEADPSSPILSVRDLAVAYSKGAVPVVKGVSFDVAPRSVTALVGESGSGKSTIVMALLGLLPGDPAVSGAATFEGRKLLTNAGAARVRGRKVGLVTQAAMNALNPAYTIHRQTAEAAALTMPREEASRRAHELLEDVGLPRDAHGAYPHELSGGMRQRVVLAIALANRPDLLIADEPTTGLDLVTQAAILRLLKDLKERLGLTVLLITHDVQMVLQVANDLVILQDGCVVECGPAERVAVAPEQEYTRRLLNTRLSPLGALADRSTSMRALLEVRGARKTFRTGLGRRRRQVTAIDDVSLSLAEGQIVALVGESGSGKSTLGRAVVGLERLDRGQLVFDGTESSRMPERKLRLLRRRMHLVLQDPYQSLHPGMRVLSAISEPLAINGIRERRARVEAALEEVGLIPPADFLDRFPHQLSGGERQRVVLARALVGRPQLVVADEPTSMVDATLRAGIVSLIRELRDRYGIAFLVITHDLDMAGAVAEQIAVMTRGRLVERGATSEILRSPSHPYTKQLLEAATEVGRLEESSAGT